MLPLATILCYFLMLMSVGDCRVKFAHSSIYDEFDFVGKTKIEIEECSSVKQCVFFVSISSDAKYADVYRNIQLYDMSLLYFAALRETATGEIKPYDVWDASDKVPVSPTYFSNDNEKQIAAPLVIYAVNLDKEPNYDQKRTAVFDAADIPKSGVARGQIVTILGAQPFTTTISGDNDTVATIFATGFDNADFNEKNPDKCRRLMQTGLDEMVSFQINGPITSIIFSNPKGNLVDSKNSINTSLAFAYDHLAMEPRGFVTSQGFIGCQSGQIYRSSLYGDRVQYSLFAPDSHFVYLELYVNTDDARPVNVHTDNTAINFNGKDLLTSQQACAQTKTLQVYFEQTKTNSFSLAYSYSNLDCDSKMLGTSASPIDPTTSSAVGFGTLSLLATAVHRALF